MQYIVHALAVVFHDGGAFFVVVVVQFRSQRNMHFSACTFILFIVVSEFFHIVTF